MLQVSHYCDVLKAEGGLPQTWNFHFSGVKMHIKKESIHLFPPHPSPTPSLHLIHLSHGLPFTYLPFKPPSRSANPIPPSSPATPSDWTDRSLWLRPYTSAPALPVELQWESVKEVFISEDRPLPPGKAGWSWGLSVRGFAEQATCLFKTKRKVCASVYACVYIPCPAVAAKVGTGKICILRWTLLPTWW